MIGETSIKRQLAGAGMVLAIAGAVVIGANQPWISVYGFGLNDRFTDIAIGLGNHACAGVELRGVPGFFGSLTDASACDY